MAAAELSWLVGPDWTGLISAAGMCRERYRGPLLACVEAPGGWQTLVRAMPVLTELPACDLPSTAADCLYPALGWQSRAARVAVVRLAQAAPWLQVHVLQCCFILALHAALSLD